MTRVVLSVILILAAAGVQAQSGTTMFEEIEEGSTVSTKPSKKSKGRADKSKQVEEDSEEGQEAASAALVKAVMKAQAEAAAAAANPPPERPGIKNVSAVVFAVREGENTEVVLKSGEILRLPTGARHNSFFNLCSESERTGKPISFKVDVETGMVLDVQAASGKSAPGVRP